MHPFSFSQREVRGWNLEKIYKIPLDLLFSFQSCLGGQGRFPLGIYCKTIFVGCVLLDHILHHIIRCFEFFLAESGIP